MPTFTLLTYQPTGDDRPQSPPTGPPSRARWQGDARGLEETGALVADHGLARVDAATTVRVSDGERQIADGPFAGTKGRFAGCFPTDAPDPDAALDPAVLATLNRQLGDVGSPGRGAGGVRRRLGDLAPDGSRRPAGRG